MVTRRGLASLAACRCRADFATECLQVLSCLKLVWKHTSSGRERGEVLPAAVYAAAMQLVLACFRRSSLLGCYRAAPSSLGNGEQ